MKEIERPYIQQKRKDFKDSINKKVGQQNLAQTSHQQTIKSLLYRNRSLKSLFARPSAVKPYCRVQNYAKNQPNASRFKPSVKQINDKSNNQKGVSVSKNQYLLKYKQHNQNVQEKRQEIRRKENWGRLKTAPNCQDYDSYRADIQLASTSYDPQSYNWRKSIKREKVDVVKQAHLHSPRQSKICFSQYYGGQVQNKLQQIKKSNVEAKPAAKSTLFQQKKHYRSKSLSSKPKVVKNVFQVRSPKARHYPSPTKSFQFTFGI